MKALANDAIITTDNEIFYYGSKKKYETQDWKEITGIVMAKDLDDPTDAETLNTMFFLAQRKKRRLFVDPAFFKKFKDID